MVALGASPTPRGVTIHETQPETERTLMKIEVVGRSHALASIITQYFPHALFDMRSKRMIRSAPTPEITVTLFDPRAAA